MVAQALELIANLSAEVARLSKRVETLERKAYVEKRKDSVKLIKPLTREEIVAKAKADVENLTKRMGSDSNEIVGNKYFRNYATKPEFVINREKRTVVSLVKGKYHPTLYSKAIAKASTDDCFNAHIGKAIALRRALGLDVPKEYAQCPQPIGKKVGDIVKWPWVLECKYRILTTRDIGGNIEFVESDEPNDIGRKANGGTLQDAIVIDDSDREVNA